MSSFQGHISDFNFNTTWTREPEEKTHAITRQSEDGKAGIVA